MGKKRILLGASYSVIEPLGLLHLGGLARDLGWERKYHLVKDHNFEPFFEAVSDFKPDIVGFNIYTGNHKQLFETYRKLKKDSPSITTVIGGPHATYFPTENSTQADYVVMSEGFGSLRKILNGTAKPGILELENTESFPHPDRETFYKFYPEHARSRIKSIITMTGCPYSCTYCYNSSGPEHIDGGRKTPIVLKILGQKDERKSHGMGNRLFPLNRRSVEDVVREGREIAERWPTEVIYMQDDVHGFNLDWIDEFGDKWNNEVGLPYHAQMRWEMTKDERRLDLLKKANCFGLTLAIEAANSHIRKEVLDRDMDEEIMYKGMKAIIDRGLKVRTEQITGLPYGATTKPTSMNLDADLELVELNVNLRKNTGGPTMAWASTLAPYNGTKLGVYCQEYGHHISNDDDVPDTFFDRSVLRFPKEWVGPKLKEIKDDERVWLDHDKLELYRDRNAELRRHFNFFTLVPEGHKLARSYLNSSEPFSYQRIGRETLKHLMFLSDTNPEAARILEKLSDIKRSVRAIGSLNGYIEEFNELVPYFACLPCGEVIPERIVRYAEQGDKRISPKILSTAVRHHLYDEVLYSTDNSRIESSRVNFRERYPSKV